MKKIDIQETGVSLARLFRVFFRNIFLVGYAFIAGLLLALIYVNSSAMPTGTYASQGTVSYRISTNTTVLNTITEIARSNNVSLLAAAALEAEGITFANGQPITSQAIQPFIQSSFISTSLRITISYTNADQTVVLPVLNAVIDATILDGNSNYPVINNNLLLGEYATTTTYDGPSTILYLAIGALLGLMLGGAIGVLWDVFKGTIFSDKDVQEIGVLAHPLTLSIPVFTISQTLKSFFSGIKPDDKELIKLLADQEKVSQTFIKIQNNLESTRADALTPMTTLITSPKPTKTNAFVALQFAKVAAKNHLKTLLIDLDYQQTALTQLVTPKTKASAKVKLAPALIDRVSKINETLYFLPSEVLTYPSKLIRSPEMVAFIKKAKETYQNIIIHAPSVLEDELLTSAKPYADTVLMVVTSGLNNTNEVIQSYNKLIDLEVFPIESLVYETKVSFNKLFSFLKK
jgi:hypothetical protein